MSDKKWNLKRTEQCEKCPWRVDVNPREIPRGYSEEKHQNLERTIAKDGAAEQVCAILNRKPLRIMACHEEHDSPCIGWLHNQLGAGNNIQLRVAMMHCTNLGEIELHGEQHQSFEETLPE